MEFKSDKIEQLIIKNLFESDVYARTYIDKLGPDIFSDKYQGIIKGLYFYYKKFHQIPKLELFEKGVLPKIHKNDDDGFNKSKEVLDDITSIQIDPAEMAGFMAEETKKFVKTRTIMNAFTKCVELVETDHDQIVSIMEKAFHLNFDESLGMEYFEGLEARLERSQIGTKIISTGIPTFDKQVGGGYRKKSMFVFAAASNVGKTLFLNDAATNMVNAGHNVLYLSLELSEDYISQRTDAKFADVSMNEINVTPANAIKKAIILRDLKKKSGKKLGKLYYKEYAPNSVSCNDIRALLKNLEAKKDFKPDFIIVDYIKLIKPQGKIYGDNMYMKLGTVCEEVRALAMEYDCCVLTAAQTGRQSFGSNSVGMEDVADSIAISQTADVLVTLARDASLDAASSILCSLVKSRFSRNVGQFMLKVDYEYMRLIDMNENADVAQIKNEKKKSSSDEKPKKEKPNDDFKDFTV